MIKLCRQTTLAAAKLILTLNVDITVKQKTLKALSYDWLYFSTIPNFEYLSFSHLNRQLSAACISLSGQELLGSPLVGVKIGFDWRNLITNTQTSPVSFKVK